MIPYFCYAVLLLLARWWENDFARDVLRWQLIDLGFLCGIGATWFLPCLFFAQLEYFCLKKFTLRFSENTQKVLLFAISLALMSVPFVITERHSVLLVIFRSLVALFFIAVGDNLLLLWQKMKLKSNCFLSITGIILLGIDITVFILTGRPGLALNVLKLGNIFVYILNSITGTVAVLTLCMVLSRLNIAKTLQFCGKESLCIMGTHQFIMLLFCIPVASSYAMNSVWCLAVMILEIPAIFAVRLLKSFSQKKGLVYGK